MHESVLFRYNTADHLRFVHIALLAWDISGDTKYLKWSTDYSREFASKIINSKDTVPVAWDADWNEFFPEDMISNEAKFLFLPSKAEGIGLSMIEALICGTIPIVCSDNETAKEFLPQEFMCEPKPESIVKYIDKMNKNYEEYRESALKLGKKYKEQFDKINVAKNILSLKK